MEKEEFLILLGETLTGFNFDEELNAGKHIHGDKKVPQIEYKDVNKDTYRVDGTRSIYISPKMGSEVNVLFYYAIIKTRGQKREYRHKNFNDVEIDKVFLSGKTYEILLQEFKNQLTLVNG